MDEKQEWIIYFAGIAAIRFHPRNDENGTTTEQIKFAAHAADLMLEERRKRQCQDGQLLQQQEQT